MARLVAGRDEALAVLMERHGASVIRFLRQTLGNEEDANDLAQETFVRVYRARESYRPEHKFTTWLFTIAANLARNQLRWRARHPNVSLEAESGDAEGTLGATLSADTVIAHEAAATTERHEAVRAAVQALPEDLREAIVLCEWEDMAVAEAAAVLETSPKAVESRLYRARGLLRARLSGWL